MAKKLGISIAIILFCFSSAYPQLLKGYGLKTGIVIADQHFEYGPYAKVETALDRKHRTGFDIGIYVEWLNLPFFSMLTEAHYVQKGMINEGIAYNEFGTLMGTVKFDNRVDYLSVPILAKIAVKTPSFSPYLVAGPRFDFLLGYNSTGGEFLYDRFKDLDMGGDIGIGVESNTRPLKVLLEFRYSPDFTYAYKSDLLKVKNNSFEILFGLGL